MADFLHEKRSEIGMRLKELKPLVDEYERLEAAAAALASVPTASVATAPPRRAARRATTASPQRPETTIKRRRGRPKGSGTRGNEALQLIKASPGITIPELAQKMGIKPNYLHRVLPGLAQDGLVTKQDRGWHPK
ncbi:MAG: MarR family transcriptional regulator [Solirubrobacteraceae bacterium]